MPSVFFEIGIEFLNAFYNKANAQIKIRKIPLKSRRYTKSL